jgi:hypothetical protein
MTRQKTFVSEPRDGSWQTPDYCPCVLNAGIILGNKSKNRFDRRFRFLRHSTFFLFFFLHIRLSFSWRERTQTTTAASISPTNLRFAVITSTILLWRMSLPSNSNQFYPQKSGHTNSFLVPEHRCTTSLQNTVHDLMFVNPRIIVHFIQKNPTRCNRVSKFIIPYLHETQYVSSDTPPIIRNLKLH